MIMPYADSGLPFPEPRNYKAWCLIRLLKDGEFAATLQPEVCKLHDS